MCYQYKSENLNPLYKLYYPEEAYTEKQAMTLKLNLVKLQILLQYVHRSTIYIYKLIKMEKNKACGRRGIFP